MNMRILCRTVILMASCCLAYLSATSCGSQSLTPSLPQVPVATISLLRLDGTELALTLVTSADPGNHRFALAVLDVGTGSVALVLQAWLPVALIAGGSITITGGTEVDRSPTIDYLEQVLFRVLASHGAKIRTEILKRPSAL